MGRYVEKTSVEQFSNGPPGLQYYPTDIGRGPYRPPESNSAAPAKTAISEPPGMSRPGQTSSPRSQQMKANAAPFIPASEKRALAQRAALAESRQDPKLDLRQFQKPDSKTDLTPKLELTSRPESKGNSGLGLTSTSTSASRPTAMPKLTKDALRDLELGSDDEEGSKTLTKPSKEEEEASDQLRQFLKANGLGHL